MQMLLEVQSTKFVFPAKEKAKANLFFNLISEMYEKQSIILKLGKVVTKSLRGRPICLSEMSGDNVGCGDYRGS